MKINNKFKINNNKYIKFKHNINHIYLQNSLRIYYKNLTNLQNYNILL